jgi:hypothetical protein
MEVVQPNVTKISRSNFADFVKNKRKELQKTGDASAEPVIWVFNTKDGIFVFF